MKKIFIASFLLPFSVLADFYSDFPSSVNQVRLIYFSSPTNSASIQFGITTNTLFSLYFNHPFAVILNRNNLEYPSFSTNSVQNPNSLAFNQRINYQLRSSISGSALYYSPLLVPEINNLYSTVQFLFASGYRGSGFSQYVEYGTRHAFNVDFKLLVSDVLSSTNTVFHRVLLSSLSSIHSNIDVLNSSLSSLASDYRSVNFSTFDFLSYLQGIEDNGVISSSQAQAYRQNYDSLSSDPSSQAAFVELAKSSIDSLHRLRNDVQNLYNMSNDPSSREQLNDIGSTINGSVDASINDFKRLSTNWQEGVKKDLQDWRNDVTNRLAHMFDDSVPIDGGNSSPVYVSGQNGGPVGVSGVVRLEGPISVGATIQGPVTLDATQINQFSSGWESIRQSIIDFHNAFTDFTASGDLPFNWISFYRLFYDFQDHSLSNQLALIRSFSVTNILNDIYSAITNNSTNVVLSAMLLDDYETFIDSSKFSDMLLAMPENLSSMLRSFGLADSSEYAGRWWVFQTANSMLQSQLLITNATLSALALSALNDIDNSFDDDDSDDSSLLSRWLSILSTLPDKEELDQAIESASNIVNNVGFERVNVFYDRATNDFSAAISTMYQDRSLPTFLRITLVPESHGRPPRFVDIPVAERAGLWSLFRSGMAYGLSIVTLILFPKYILWLLTRYTRLMEKIIKSLKAYTEM